jgi:diketogulonate reductase-like aldo/keto reductase
MAAIRGGQTVRAGMSAPMIDANGARIPAFGLGTWDLRGRTCVRMVEQALRLGYRHLDTAEMYDNETEVGEGLRASGVAREQVFITTKVWSSHLAARDLEHAAKQSLVKLKLAHVDLLLIHWPNPRIQLSETIPALCKMKSLGVTRHVGVSNFTPPLVDEAVRLATEPLVNDQIEWHPFIDQPRPAPPAADMGSRSRLTVRSRRAGHPTTRCWPRSARVTARAPARSRCGSCCRRGRLSFRARPSPSGWRKISTCSISR